MAYKVPFYWEGSNKEQKAKWEELKKSIIVLSFQDPLQSIDLINKMDEALEKKISDLRSNMWINIGVASLLFISIFSGSPVFIFLSLVVVGVIGYAAFNISESINFWQEQRAEILLIKLKIMEENS